MKPALPLLLTLSTVSFCTFADTTTLSVPATGVIPVSANCVTTSTIPVTNTGSVTATNVSASLPWGPGIVQDASDCASIEPGATCHLTLCSDHPYIATGNIPIVGDNISSPPTMAIAFTHTGYLIISVENATNMTIVDDVDVSYNRWSGIFPGTATSTTDGHANTVNVINASTSSGAAMDCFTSTHGGFGQGSWYLPAICQLGGNGEGAGCTSSPSTFSNLIQLGFIPQANAQIYWSSSQYVNPQGAWLEQPVYRSGSAQSGYPINALFKVRCMASVHYPT